MVFWKKKPKKVQATAGPASPSTDTRHSRVGDAQAAHFAKMKQNIKERNKDLENRATAYAKAASSVELRPIDDHQTRRSLAHWSAHDPELAAKQAELARMQAEAEAADHQLTQRRESISRLAARKRHLGLHGRRGRGAATPRLRRG